MTLPSGLTSTPGSLDPGTLDVTADLLAEVGTTGLDGHHVADLDSVDRLPDEARGWRIRDVGTAEWAAGVRAEAAARVHVAEQQANEWIGRVRQWLVETTRRDAATVAFMEAHLQRFALDRREETGEATLRLPSAVVRTRRQAAQPAVRDDYEVADWLREWDPKLAREVVKEEVRLDKWRRHVTIAHVPDGCEVVVRLDCGHDVGDRLPVESDPAKAYPVGCLLTCPACAVDPMAEGAYRVLVEVVDVRELTRLAVFGPGGEEVPGAYVEPERVTAKVSDR